MLRGGFRAGKTPWGGTHPGRGRKERSEHSCGTQAGEEVREEPRGHASIQGASQEQGEGEGPGQRGARKEEIGIEGAGLFLQILKTAMRNEYSSPVCLELAQYSKSLAGVQREVISDSGTGIMLVFERERETDQKNLLNCMMSSGVKKTRYCSRIPSWHGEVLPIRG